MALDLPVPSWRLLSRAHVNATCGINSARFQRWYLRKLGMGALMRQIISIIHGVLLVAIWICVIGIVIAVLDSGGPKWLLLASGFVAAISTVALVEEFLEWRSLRELRRVHWSKEASSLGRRRENHAISNHHHNTRHTRRFRCRDRKGAFPSPARRPLSKRPAQE
jgi:ABC-type nickel/cobalt efflux system permease component RcnA